MILKIFYQVEAKKSIQLKKLMSKLTELGEVEENVCDQTILPSLILFHFHKERDKDFSNRDLLGRVNQVSGLKVSSLCNSGVAKLNQENQLS